MWISPYLKYLENPIEDRDTMQKIPYYDMKCYEMAYKVNDRTVDDSQGLK